MTLLYNLWYPRRCQMVWNDIPHRVDSRQTDYCAALPSLVSNLPLIAHDSIEGELIFHLACCIYSSTRTRQPNFPRVLDKKLFVR